jgi:formylmethanofuran dehydrogenase subunit E
MNMDPFDRLLEQSAAAHGHLCPGQVVGVRMAMLGCRLIGLDDPRSRDQIKKLLVYVEMDRCTADAVAHVTGVKLGRRSLKFMDYGIMAATFVNLETDRAFRIISTEESRDLCEIYAPEPEEKSRKQLLAYKRMPDSVLFRVQKVQVPVREVDLPGPTRVKVTCTRCGQVVRDGRQVENQGRILCKPCAGNCYFSHAKEVAWPDMNWSPAIDKEDIPC